MKNNLKNKIKDFNENNKPWLKAKNALNKASMSISSNWESFLDTKTGKVFQVVTSSAVVRTASIVLACLTIAGVTTALAPPIGIAVGTLGLASVALGAGISVYRTRSLRRLKSEHDSLIKYRIAKDGQDNLLKANPKLTNILQDHLSAPVADPLAQKRKKYLKPQTKDHLIPKTIAKTALANSIDIAGALLNGIATGGISIATNIGVTAFNLVTNSKFNVDMEKAGFKLKKGIDKQTDEADSPNYKNLRDLKNKSKKQIVQTRALEELVNDPNYGKMSEQEIKNRFLELRHEYSSQVKFASLKRTTFEKAIRVGEEISHDFVRAHDPFSKYNNPRKLKGLEIPKASPDKKVAFEDQTLKQALKPIRKVVDANNSRGSLRKKPNLSAKHTSARSKI